MRAAGMGNPTLVVITDRNDLDDQLFGEVFAPARILPEEPRQADSRAELRRPARPRVRRDHLHHDPEVRARGAGRRAPAADRPAQRRRDRRRGAPLPVRLPRRLRPAPARRACPTPPTSGSPARRSRSTDRSTRQVFGDYIDVYDLTRAVEDGATVRIFYESRLAKVRLPEEARAEIDAEVAEVTEGPGAHRGRASEDPLGAGRGDRRRRRAARRARRRHRRALGAAPGEPRRQGDDRRDVPAHLRRALRADRRAAARLARSDDPDQGPDQGRHDRLRRRPAGVPAAPPPDGRRSDSSRPARRIPTTRSSS